MTATRPAVFVVNDDPAVREALGTLIQSAGLRPHLCGSVRELLTTPMPDAPACLVLDVGGADLGSLDCQRRLVEAGIKVPIIFLTDPSDISMSAWVMRAGVAHSLSRPFRDQDLLDAVELALEQDSYRREEQQAVAELRDRFDSLSPAERDVMWWVASGRLNKQIAAKLCTTEAAVKSHRLDVMRKMEAGSVSDLARMAVMLGLALKF